MKKKIFALVVALVLFIPVSMQWLNYVRDSYNHFFSNEKRGMNSFEMEDTVAVASENREEIIEIDIDEEIEEEIIEKTEKEINVPTYSEQKIKEDEPVIKPEIKHVEPEVQKIEKSENEADHIEESTLLKFKVMTDSTVWVVYDESYADYKIIRIPAQTEIDGKSYTVVGIADGAFADCVRLQYVVIPSNVKRIGNRSFYGCLSLRRCFIHNGVTHIGDSAFEKCNMMLNVNIPSSVTTIGKNAFKFKDPVRMLRVDIDNKKDNIQCGKDAFAGCYVVYK